jgi:iron complex transport system ATP-binding protein
VNNADQFLILDEPTSALDLSHQMLALDLVSNLANRGVGILLVVHDLNLAARCADTIVVFDKGCNVSSGYPDEVINEKLITSVFGVTPLIMKHPVTGKPLVLNQ